MRNRLILFVAFATPIILAFVGPAPLTAGAQTASAPNLVITWRATDSSAPSSYRSKVLPGINSPITASLEVVRNGGLASLANQTIYWYLDGNLIGEGTGKQTVNFVTPGFLEIASLRAEIPDYPAGALINTAHIQLVSPEAVIVAPYANGVYSGSSIAVQAVPYFFRASTLDQLYYQWTVNGQAVTTQENPQDLTVNLSNGAPTSAGVPVAIALAMQESGSTPAAAGSSITLNPANQ
jgi:hypothetical protein